MRDSAGAAEATAELATRLKAAAHEGIAAAHAALDVVEALMEDPAPVARAVENLIAGARATRRRSQAGEEPPAGEQGRVEHIRVS
ncbi:MAG TPA: hypothetical protein VFP54_09010 [Acidimicrobiales bacterium]|nr:hypothetical protein [Acidimicrobiales bacterium]